MSKDELIELWESQEKKLDKTLKMNEVLLKKINYNKTRHEFKNTLNLELANLWAIPIITIISFFQCQYYNWAGYLLLVFVTILILGVVSMIFYSKRYKMLKEILTFNLPITKSLKNIYEYQAFFNKYKKYEYILGPILGVCFFYILSFHDKKYEENIQLLVGSIIAVLVLGTLLVYFGYKYYFTKKIQNSIRYLKELEEFES